MSKKKRKVKKKRGLVTLGMLLTRKGGPMRDRRIRREKEKEKKIEEDL